jgi:hypothetical protein
VDAAAEAEDEGTATATAAVGLWGTWVLEEGAAGEGIDVLAGTFSTWGSLLDEATTTTDEVLCSTTDVVDVTWLMMVVVGTVEDGTAGAGTEVVEV